MLYNKLVLEVFNKLRKEITEKANLILTYEMPISLTQSYQADILIYQGDWHVAVVDVKQLSNTDNFKYAEEELKVVAFNQGYQFAIITDGQNCKIWELTKGPQSNYHNCSFNDLINKFKHIRTKEFDGEPIGNLVNEFVNEVKSIANDYLREDEGRLSRIKEYLDNCKETDFVVKDGKLQFSDVKKENQFFEQLIEKYEDKTVYRYTSLDSLFLTLKTKMQGMCCLVGMNDKSEVYYADKYVGLNKGKTAYDHKKENKYFILSCVEDSPDENFLMWRLYGDNTKGVRIQYTPKTMPEGFRFCKIYYGKKDNTHPGLDIVKEMQNKSIGSLYFRFTHFDYWKHFFKPYDYEIEKEVRLLYELIDSNPPEKIDWIKGSEFSILIPLALFKEVQFPLDIEEIKIGPNMMSRETNLLQIQQLVDDNKILPISKDTENHILDSRIDHYRS